MFERIIAFVLLLYCFSFALHSMSSTYCFKCDDNGYFYVSKNKKNYRLLREDEYSFNADGHLEYFAAKEGYLISFTEMPHEEITVQLPPLLESDEPAPVPRTYLDYIRNRWFENYQGKDIEGWFFFRDKQGNIFNSSDKGKIYGFLDRENKIIKNYFVKQQNGVFHFYPEDNSKFIVVNRKEVPIYDLQAEYEKLVSNQALSNESGSLENIPSGITPPLSPWRKRVSGGSPGKKFIAEKRKSKSDLKD